MDTNSRLKMIALITCVISGEFCRSLLLFTVVCRYWTGQIWRVAVHSHINILTTTTDWYQQVNASPCVCETRIWRTVFRLTISSAIAEGPRDALCLLISCQLLHNCTGWAKKVIPLVQCNICTRGITFLAHPVRKITFEKAYINTYSVVQLKWYQLSQAKTSVRTTLVDPPCISYPDPISDL